MAPLADFVGLAGWDAHAGLDKKINKNRNSDNKSKNEKRSKSKNKHESNRKIK